MKENVNVLPVFCLFKQFLFPGVKYSSSALASLWPWELQLQFPFLLK